LTEEEAEADAEIEDENENEDEETRGKKLRTEQHKRGQLVGFAEIGDGGRGGLKIGNLRFQRRPR